MKGLAAILYTILRQPLMNRCEILTLVLCHQSEPRPALFTVNSHLMTACDTVTLNPMSAVLKGPTVITHYPACNAGHYGYFGRRTAIGPVPQLIVYL